VAPDKVVLAIPAPQAERTVVSEMIAMTIFMIFIMGIIMLSIETVILCPPIIFSTFAMDIFRE